MIFNSRSKIILTSVRGFTLIEMLIAMTIMLVISLAIYQATTQTYRLRDILVREGDFYNSIRLSMGIFETDVSQLYSPIALVAPTPTPSPGAPPAAAPAKVDPDLQAVLSSDIGQVTDYWLAATDKTGIRLSRFVGTDANVSFIASSHRRLYKDRPESDFAKIRYELREDKDPELAIEGSKVLVKIEDPNAFDDSKAKKNTTAKEYFLLHGVKSLAFRFFRQDKKEWEKTWDTSKDENQGTYPDLIEVKMEIVGPKRLTYQGTYIFRPEFPFGGLDASF